MELFGRSQSKILFVVITVKKWLSRKFMIFWFSFLLLEFPNCNETSRPVVFYLESVIKNFTKNAKNPLCQSLFFNKVAGLRPATLLKKRRQNRCFPVIFVKFLTLHSLNQFFQNNFDGCFCC